MVAANSSFLIGTGVYADNVHLIRFHRQNGQVANDTMLYRPGQTYAASVLRAANGQLVIGGSYNNGQYGGADLFLAAWSAYRPLASRASTGPLAAGMQAFPNPAGAAGATVALPEAVRAGPVARWPYSTRWVGPALACPWPLARPPCRCHSLRCRRACTCCATKGATGSG